MEITSFKTRRFEPPQDDVFSELNHIIPPLQNRDVIVLASKIIAIHEGRSVPMTTPEERSALIEKESDFIIPTGHPGGWDLTVKNDMVTFAGGIDESNAGGFVVLLPEDPTASAFRMRKFFLERDALSDLGVIIADSSALPFRQGVVGMSIGHAGFEPVQDFVGTPDLFGRELRYTVINAVDALAIAASYHMGEANECTPVCLIRNAPRLTFTDHDMSHLLRIKPEHDIFDPLFKKYR